MKNIRSSDDVMVTKFFLSQEDLQMRTMMQDQGSITDRVSNRVSGKSERSGSLYRCSESKPTCNKV